MKSIHIEALPSFEMQKVQTRLAEEVELSDFFFGQGYSMISVYFVNPLLH